MNRKTPRRHRMVFALAALATGTGVGLVATAGTAQSAPPAPAAVYSGFKNQFTLTTVANGEREVGRLRLPAGSYTIFAKLNLDVASGGNQHIRCFLRAGGDFDRSIANHDGTIAFMPMSLNVVHTFAAPGSVVLRCGHVFAGGSTPVSFIKITAIRASSLSNTPMP
ncbi:hypothetical protein ACJWDR_18770 [Streptomyces tauricus]|uniref:hypothetical protein n=1 Tax=Streptomyces tauricus TaxID=68274 RepID=UPI00387F1899